MNMTLTHFLWHVALQISVIVCATIPMNQSKVCLFPDPIPVVVVDADGRIEVQNPGVFGDVLLTCQKHMKHCAVAKGHTLDEAMQQIGQAVITYQTLKPEAR